MNSLEADLELARSLSVDELADAIESIGFECTRCGACCKAETCGEEVPSDEELATDATPGDEREPDSQSVDESDGEHTATVFPDEIRRLMATGEYDWRDVARPMPYGLSEGEDGPTGQTFEWALQTDDCGDCTFYDESGEEPGTCTVYGDRPLICRTYPFSIALGGTSQPMGEAVDREGLVRAHECDGLGRDISREAATDLAATLKQRAIRELEEAIAVREAYQPVDTAKRADVVVYDSEGPKRPDGTAIE